MFHRPAVRSPAFCGATVCDPEQDTKAQHGPANDGRAAQQVSQAKQLQSQAKDHHRNRGNDQAQRQKGARGIEAKLHKRQQPLCCQGHIAPEIQNDGKQGAHMYGNIEDKALIFHACQFGQQYEMGR